MVRKGFSAVLVLALIVVSLVPALSAFAQEPLIESVCLVTDLGRVNDGTFNQFTYEGMIRAADDFDLDSTFIETQAQTDYAANIDTCLSEEYDAIVTVGFLIADATAQAAAANPDNRVIVLWLNEPDASRVIDLLAALSHSASFSVGCYCDDERHCHRGILRDLLIERGARIERP
mgnify:CR=1 FL=1